MHPGYADKLWKSEGNSSLTMVTDEMVERVC